MSMEAFGLKYQNVLKSSLDNASAITLCEHSIYMQ